MVLGENRCTECSDFFCFYHVAKVHHHIHNRYGHVYGWDVPDDYAAIRLKDRTGIENTKKYNSRPENNAACLRGVTAVIVDENG